MAVATGWASSGSSPTGRRALVLDLVGVRVELTAADVERLRAAAAAQAGRSSRARDLSVLLERARLASQPVALRAGERKTLARIASEAGLDELMTRLSPTPPRQAGLTG